MEITLKITGRYLWLPCCRDADPVKLNFYADGPAPSLFTVDHGIIEYYSSDGLLYGAVEAEEDVLSKTFDPGPGAVSIKVLRRGKEKKIS